MSITSKQNEINVRKFFDWMNKTNRANIVSFDISGLELKGLFDSDSADHYSGGLIYGLSELINKYKTVSQKTKNNFIFNSDQGEWQLGGNNDYYNCYQLIKILWLIEDLRKVGQEAPMQLIKSIGAQYRCHPGSDKRYAMTLLEIFDSVRCFYIHYPELDPNPWHNTYPHKKIETVEEFIDMFPMANHSTFGFQHDTVELNGIDGFNTIAHFEPFASSSNQVLMKQDNNKIAFQSITVEHLSYKDEIHREQIQAHTELLNNIYFEDEKTFWMGDYKFDLVTFKRGDTIWIPEQYNNFPESLIDTEWKYDSSRAISFSIDYSRGKI